MSSYNGRMSQIAKSNDGRLVYDSDAYPPFRISADDFFAMLKAGIIEGGRGVELIDGILVRMSPANLPHSHALAELQKHLGAFREHCQVLAGSTVRLLDHHVFDPDVMLVRNEFSYRNGFPDGQDILLLIEVSDTTLPKDLGPKRDAYAAAGIAEYWVVDLEGRRLLVHRDPKDGLYPDPAVFTEHDRVVPRVLPDAALRVGDLLA